MSNTVDFDLLLYRLEGIMADSLYCEDNELRIRNKCKYALYNLLEEIDPKFIKKIKKEFDYNE